MTNKIVPSCEKVQGKLNSFLDNALAGRDAINIAAHLESCPACYQEFRGLEAVRDAVRRLPAPSSSDAVRLRAFQRLENVVHAGESSTTNARPHRWSATFLHSITGWSSAMATLMAAAAAAGIVFLVPLSQNRDTPLPSPVSSQVVPSEAEIHDLFTLHDVHAAEWTGDDTLARRDAAAQAHGALLGRADAAVTGSL